MSQNNKDFKGYSTNDRNDSNLTGSFLDNSHTSQDYQAAPFKEEN